MLEVWQMVKRVKKPNRKKLILEADKLWSSIIRARDGKCIYCGSKIHLNAHHIFSKARHGNLRWNTDNGITLCAKCHIYGVHVNPAPYILRIIEHVGNDIMEKLREQAQTKPAPIRIDDIRLVIKNLTAGVS